MKDEMTIPKLDLPDYSIALSILSVFVDRRNKDDGVFRQRKTPPAEITNGVRCLGKLNT